ncbi:MAG: T9SS type A sorting domain-containing protein [Ignavibacteriales bacterium]|nr:MAG: T9SS type A sorting domain-containing protein [Ignavibacteriales bacterium]
METGATENFTVTITGGPLTAAGTNIAASSGTLNVLEGLQKIGQELTHTSPRAATGGSVVFEFSYTAPATAGDIILYANGNSVNLNGNNTGDQWNFASNKTITVQTPTGVDDENILNAFKLEQNYPNPFNPTTRIDYKVGGATNVSLVVYSSSGEEVTTLVNEFKSAGSYSVNFDGTGLSSGVYYYRLTANNFIETRKFVLMK